MDTRSAEEIRADLSYLFDKASQALAARMADSLATLRISPRDYCVLSKAGSAALTQGELAELALMDKTTMVVTLDRLEGDGLARRTPSPTDRRARIVETTDAGYSTVAQARTVIDNLYADVLGVLPAEQREVFLDALVTLVGPDGPLSEVEATPNAPRRRATRSSRTQ
ncbi:MarR family transcriptional regulator [Pseudonocardia aurantiaca]|uniref:MarR family winged helix-turn-helix transcriptional regulator n=1 Tax=Pseudonocardia aurantiaca TaxID=75290 RepID=A0ABW4FP95_9PSEU